MILALTLSFLTQAAVPEAPAPRVPVLLVGGANNHWWQWTDESLESILLESGKFAVTLSTQAAVSLADKESLSQYRAVVLNYNGPRWGELAEKNFVEAVRAGLGVVVIHAANNAFEGWKEYEEIVALCWREGTGHGSFHPFDVRVIDRDHPITRDLPDLLAHPDELYHKLVPMHDTDYRVLATAYASPESGGTGTNEPMVIVKNYGKGRVFHTPLGHVWGGADDQKVSHYDPQFRDLVVRGTEWAATGEVTAALPSAPVLTSAEAEAGWQLLFDGKTTAGWRGFKQTQFPAQGWSVEADGSLHKIAGAGGGDIVSERTYSNFEMRFEWKVAAGANSGVMYRVSEAYDNPWQTGPEYQILDDALHNDGKNPKTSAAALYALIAAERKQCRPPGQWNYGRIRLSGNQLEHWLNGVRVLQCELGSDAWLALVGSSKFKDMPGFGKESAGHIVLQDHGDDVWYRNLALKEL